MTPLEKAKGAVRAWRDFAPKDGKHFEAQEVEMLGRLCADAVKACEAAGLTIAEMRRQLWAEERAGRSQ